MSAYISILGFSCTILMISARLSLAAQRIASYMVISLLTVFSGLRGYVGTDTYSYHRIFLDAADEMQGGLYLRIEPLFALLIDLVGALGFGSFVFIATISVLQGLLLIFIIRFLSAPASFLAIYVAVFYLNLHFNIVRSGTSILFALIAIGLMKEGGRRWLVVLFSGLSFATHYATSVLIGTLVLFSSKGRKWLHVGLALLVPMLLGMFFLGLNDDLAGKVVVYSEVLSEPRRQGGGLTLFLALPLYSLLFLISFGSTSNMNKVLMSSIFAAWISLRVLTYFYEIIGRIEVLFGMAFLFIVFSVELSGMAGRLRRYITLSLVFSYITVGLYSLSQESHYLVDSLGDSVENISPFVPYRFAWEEI